MVIRISAGLQFGWGGQLLKNLSRQELLRLARAGAQVRLNELQEEIKGIVKSFPELKGGGSSSQSAAVAAPVRRQRAPKARATRGWSAAARREVSERMKKYWAARRAAAAKKR
jgi:hypothetical protein